MVYIPLFSTQEPHGSELQSHCCHSETRAQDNRVTPGDRAGSPGQRKDLYFIHLSSFILINSRARMTSSQCKYLPKTPSLLEKGIQVIQRRQMFNIQSDNCVTDTLDPITWRQSIYQSPHSKSIYTERILYIWTYIHKASQSTSADLGSGHPCPY